MAGASSLMCSAWVVQDTLPPEARSSSRLVAGKLPIRRQHGVWRWCKAATVLQWCLGDLAAVLLNGGGERRCICCACGLVWSDGVGLGGMRHAVSGAHSGRTESSPSVLGVAPTVCSRSAADALWAAGARLLAGGGPGSSRVWR